MNIPPKYEDVVAQLEAEKMINLAGEHVESHLEKQIDILRIDLDAALGREAALREELKTLSAVRNQNRALAETVKEVEFIDVSLRQRLTVAEQRAGELKKLLCAVINESPTGFADLKVDLANRVNDALQPAEVDRDD